MDKKVPMLFRKRLVNWDNGDDRADCEPQDPLEASPVAAHVHRAKVSMLAAWVYTSND